MGVGGQRHTQAALPPVKTPYILYRRMGGPQGWSGRVRKISPQPGFHFPTVRSVTGRYTDYIIGTVFILLALEFFLNFSTPCI